MPAPSSIRSVLVAAMLAVALVPAALIGVVGVRSITSSVGSEAQSRVDQDLEIVLASYADQLAHLAYSLEVSSHRVQGHQRTAESLALLRRELGLTVLNLCDAQGQPLAGSQAAAARPVASSQDPVLRQALEGRPAWHRALHGEAHRRAARRPGLGGVRAGCLGGLPSAPPCPVRRAGGGGLRSGRRGGPALSGPAGP